MRGWTLAVVLLAVGCGSSDEMAMGGGGAGGFGGGSFPPAPTQPPPTGGRWKGVTVENECGRTTIEWVVVDETCGDVDSPSYLDAFEAPMFRDGTIVAGSMYVVDASALWVLDALDPAKLERRALLTGFGRPLAVAQHAGNVVVAAADSGLLVLDVTEPLSPVVKSAIDIQGLALDVHVDGDRAYVASGKSGLSVVDLAADPPAVVQTIAMPGFAAGVVARGEQAVVAACDKLAVVDVASGAVSGQVWLDQAYDGDLLVAPAKDVELVGDVAFVAAGRWGAVAVDVSAPDAPAVLGNCTIQDDLAFYASGVRSDGQALFVAGGEWGVLKVDATNPAAACTTSAQPLYLPPPAPSGSCTTEPPWNVVDWQTRWAPPPPPPPALPGVPPAGRDPIQVLPQNGVVYAFGDARRIGLRAVDARDPLDPVLARIGRYDEPWLVEDIAARDARLLVVGAAGTLFDILQDGTLSRVDLPLARDSVAGELLPDGRWVLATKDGKLAIEGETPIALSTEVFPKGLALRADQIILPTMTGLMLFDSSAALASATPYGKTAHLPRAVTLLGDRIVVAAPEWTQSLEVSEASVTELPAHGVFNDSEILDASLWQVGIPRRVLVAAGEALVEIASLGNRAGLYDHQSGGRISLPAGTYAGGAWVDNRVHLAVADRGRYRSEIVSVLLDATGPTLSSLESFTGVATDVTTDGTRLFVGDADGAIRIYEIDASGRPALLSIERLQVTE